MSSSPEKDEEAVPQSRPENTGLVARFRQRLFPARAAEAVSTELAPQSKRGLSLRAGISELLLITRLKARSQGSQAAEMLERAANIVFVTCKNWFSARDEKTKTPEHRKPL
ncbi:MULTISPECIES: hypothetical protein [Polaromonas]|uniref:Homeobox domain-containing protein n=1 Tax=Polaromonas aquatica TaxID=332657 RepID=A0ABW1TZC7_9BURK